MGNREFTHRDTEGNLSLVLCSVSLWPWANILFVSGLAFASALKGSGCEAREPAGGRFEGVEQKADFVAGVEPAERDAKRSASLYGVHAHCDEDVRGIARMVRAASASA